VKFLEVFVVTLLKPMTHHHRVVSTTWRIAPDKGSAGQDSNKPDTAPECAISTPARLHREFHVWERWNYGIDSPPFPPPDQTHTEHQVLATYSSLSGPYYISALQNSNSVQVWHYRDTFSRIQTLFLKRFATLDIRNCILPLVANSDSTHNRQTVLHKQAYFQHLQAPVLDI